MRQERLLNFMISRMPFIMLILCLIVRAWVVNAETQTIEHSAIKDYNFTQENLGHRVTQCAQRFNGNLNHVTTL